MAAGPTDPGGSQLVFQLYPILAGPIFQSKGKPEDFCGTHPKVPCRLVWNLTHSPGTSRFVHAWNIDLWANKIVAIIVTIVIALILRHIVHKTISNITTRMAEGTMSEKIREKTRTIFDGSPALVSERRRQRAETMESLLRSIASIIILGTATFSVLGEIGLNLAPVLASASIIGVAVAFGAQNLVKDFLSGIFMLLEDQYGVGDVIDVGPAKGTVEAVTLRVTRLRDINGVVWYMRNGEILRIGNESQNWARAVLDIPVSYAEDVDKVRSILEATAARMTIEPPWDEIVLEEPSVWGVQALTGAAVTVRVVVKTAPGKQGEVARELRARVKKAFDEAGISVVTLTE
jgi:small-conductance mechanosensitive channel